MIKDKPHTIDKWAQEATHRPKCKVGGPIGRPADQAGYQLVYGKTCHLPVELEHRVHWAIRRWNMDLKIVGEYWRHQISELEE